MAGSNSRPPRCHDHDRGAKASRLSLGGRRRRPRNRHDLLRRILQGPVLAPAASIRGLFQNKGPAGGGALCSSQQCISGGGSCRDLTISFCLYVPVGGNSHRCEAMSDGAPIAPVVSERKHGVGSLFDTDVSRTRREARQICHFAKTAREFQDNSCGRRDLKHVRLLLPA